MPLDSKQRKIVSDGKAGCADCGAHLAELQMLGFPYTDMEQKYEAMTKFYGAADDIVSQWDEDQKGGKKRGS